MNVLIGAHSTHSALLSTKPHYLQGNTDVFSRKSNLSIKGRNVDMDKRNLFLTLLMLVGPMSGTLHTLTRKSLMQKFCVKSLELEHF